MALPGDVASTVPVIAPYIPPYDRPKMPLEDFEAGGIAINDGSQGLDVQIWHLTWDEVTGDFTVRPETIGAPSVVHNASDVVSCALAWNQNMDVAIAYEQLDGSVHLYWWDPVPADFTVFDLPAGSRSPQLCLDDHRQLSTGTSDIILGYMRAGSLYYRQQRDRFLTERELRSGAGTAKLRRVGMTENYRLKFDVRVGSGETLCDIVGDLHLESGISGARQDHRELCETPVRGLLIATPHANADTLKSLQRLYFFDTPLVDGKQVSRLRGRPVEFVIPLDDFVVGEEPRIESSREQEVEFPRKLHLQIANRETNYTATPATSELLGPDFRGMTELNVETVSNLTLQEATDRVRIAHKEMLSEREGKPKFGLSEKWAQLIPSSVCMIEVKTNVFRRVRLLQSTFSEGFFRWESVSDRGAATYISGAIAAYNFAAAPPPPSNLPGQTTWEYGDIPALTVNQDFLHYAVFAYGASAAWIGGELQRDTTGAGDYVAEEDVTQSSLIGTLDAELPVSSELYTDTTNEVLFTTASGLAPESVSDQQLLQGRNAFLVGNEIVQVRDWDQIDADSYRGTVLLRGRLNTTPVTHAAGTRIVSLDAPTFVEADTTLIGLTFNLRIPSFGTLQSSATPQSVVFTGRSQREWAPLDLAGVKVGNDWSFSWLPRHRLGSADNPIVSANFAGYRIQITKGATTVIRDITGSSLTYTQAEQIADFGAAQSSWDLVEVMGLNRLTGEGDSASGAF